MYIALTKKKYKDTYHKQILLRESYREDGKVKSRTLLNLTNKPKHQVNAIVAAIKNKEEITIASSICCERSEEMPLGCNIEVKLLD